MARSQTGDYARPAADPKLGYLDFVDGIRALAVAAVLLFHADRNLVQGGYVGVDIFFVLSGFLITRICIGPRFTFLSFWAGRCRRILPAYLATMAVTSLITAALLLPGDARDTAKSIISVPLFLQNFVLWKQTDYFSPALETNPLLHTWSLAVEWQFYLLFPFFVRAFATRRPLLVVAAILLFMVSLLISSWGAIFRPTPAFYLTPFRTWEFLAGALVALVPPAPKQRRYLPLLVSIVGLAMILAAIFLFTPTTTFPGAAALLPCIGTAAIMVGGLMERTNRLARFLSLAPLRVVGQASYSIYLVHWPILVFIRYWFVTPEPPFVTGLAIVASVAFGFVSWRYVERPFRVARPDAVARRAKLSLSAMAAIAATGVAILLTQGFPARFSPDVRRIASAAEDKGAFRICLEKEPPTSLAAGTCRLGRAGSTTQVVLWGDSLAAALASGLNDEAARRGLTGVFVGTDSCPPLPGMEGSFPSAMARCRRIQAAMPKLLAAAPARVLIVHASWRSYYERDPQEFARRVQMSFSQYHGLAKAIVIVGAVPGARMDLPGALARLAAFGG